MYLDGLRAIWCLGCAGATYSEPKQLHLEHKCGSWLYAHQLTFCGSVVQVCRCNMDISRLDRTQMDYGYELSLRRKQWKPSNSPVCPPWTLPPVLAPGLVAVMAARP